MDIKGKGRRIEVLKAGDSVLVQVVKDAMGHKGARLTNQISLAGRYLVLAPDADVRGISRRLPEDERRRLREIVAELRPKDMGAIVRTAARTRILMSFSSLAITAFVFSWAIWEFK